MKIQITESDKSALMQRILREMFEGNEVGGQNEAFAGLEEAARSASVDLEQKAELLQEKAQMVMQAPRVAQQIYSELQQQAGAGEIIPGKYAGWYTIRLNEPFQYNEEQDCWFSRSGRQVENFDELCDDIIPEQWKKYIDIYTDEHNNNFTAITSLQLTISLDDIANVEFED